MKRRHRTLVLVASVMLSNLLPLGGRAEEADDYRRLVKPFMREYCSECHSSKKARGELDLSRYSKASDVTRDFRRWSHVIEFIRKGEMPPAEGRQPTPAQRQKVVRALEEILLTEARKFAGDPGVILPRRLSNTEYDRSIRDLTGVDIRPTKKFPVDPAGGEGFDNTGEALTMSPSLLKKYLNAAQHVSNHLVLKTTGMTFAPFPVTSYNERKKLAEQAIIDFYRDHDVHTADYMSAAWRFRHRRNAERELEISDWADREGLSPKYLSLVWKTLSDASSSTGYLKRLGELWEATPPPTNDGKRPSELLAVEQFIEFCRRNLCHREESLIRSNAGNWPIQHLDFRAKTAAVRDRFDGGNLDATRLMRFDRLRAPKQNDKSKAAAYYLRIDPGLDGSQGAYLLLHRPIFSKSGNRPRNDKEEQKHEVVTLRSVLERHAPEVAKGLRFGVHPLGHKIDADSLAIQAPALIELPLNSELLREVDGKQLLVQCRLDLEHSREAVLHVQTSSGRRPENSYGADVAMLVHADSELAKSLAASSEQFCHAFPNRFVYVNDKRGLAAGFHLVEGFFRDDQPLIQKVLDDRQRRELDQLWEELHFVTRSAETLLRGFVWFERSERHVLHDKRFDFLRPEDPKLVESQMLTRFERVYLDKMGVKLKEGSLAPEKPSDRYDMIHGFFQQIRAGLARHRQVTASAEGRGLLDLEAVAHRAYGRELEKREIERLRKLHQNLRSQGQGVEESLRGGFMAVLMSPDFCYRYSEPPSGSDVYPLANEALASRLSYFLWSSLPDEELLRAARKGELQDGAALLAQTRRMLQSPKVDAFAREFFGQWLRYRDYLSKDPINAEAFPSYRDELRQAMFEEPVRLVTFLIQQDKPVTALLNSDTTFVNEVLARHYGGAIAADYAKLASNARTGTDVDATVDTWRRVEGLREAGRGGLFGMGVILTKNSAGERTSPVKRGFWTVHHLLGQHFPPPPADVPELPTNERRTKKTIRELIGEHTANPKCAMCHTHFDSLGMTLEGFDPIGRTRRQDLAGRPVDDVARLPNGETAKGVAGLITYIERHRREEFIRTLCRSFLGYALGRSVALSDQPLLRDLEVALKNNNYRFSVLFETVVRSPQFRKQRGRGFVAAIR